MLRYVVAVKSFYFIMFQASNIGESFLKLPFIRVFESSFMIHIVEAK